MKHKLAACAIAALWLSGCATMPSPVMVHPESRPVFLSPVPSSRTELIVNGAPVMTYWASMTQTDVRNALSLQFEEAVVEQIATDGTATLLPASGEFRKGSYRVTYMYFKTRSAACPNAAAGNLFSGIGIRMTANVTTRKGKASLGDLMGLTASLSRNEARGSLKIQTFGISSGTASITPYLSSTNSLTPQGMQKAIESFGVIKAVIDTPSVQLTPYDLYVEGPTPLLCTTVPPPANG